MMRMVWAATQIHTALMFSSYCWPRQVAIMIAIKQMYLLSLAQTIVSCF